MFHFSISTNIVNKKVILGIKCKFVFPQILASNIVIESIAESYNCMYFGGLDNLWYSAVISLNIVYSRK